VKSGGAIAVLLALAALTAPAQQARYRGPSSTLPPWKMDMQITPYMGPDWVTTQVYNGNPPYDGFGGKYDPATMTLSPGNVISWTLPGGVVGTSTVTGGLVGGPLGSPASEFDVAVGPMPVSFGSVGGVGFATQSFILTNILPAAGGVGPAPGNGAPTHPTAPERFTGSGLYGYTGVSVDLVFEPNGNWVGTVTVTRVQPSPNNPAGVRLPDTVLDVQGVLNLNQGPIVKLVLSPRVPLPNPPNSPECDVSFSSSHRIVCNVLQIPDVWITSFIVVANN
jgi:hypothetical protein